MNKKKITKEDKLKIANNINYYRTLPKNVRDSASNLKPKDQKVLTCPCCGHKIKYEPKP